MVVDCDSAGSDRKIDRFKPQRPQKYSKTDMGIDITTDYTTNLRYIGAK